MNCAVKPEEYSETSPTRDDLVNTNIGFVKFLVDRMAAVLPKHIDRDDLMGAAYLGLIKAASRFDHHHEVVFRTFAESHIRGAIMDELRSTDNLSRGLRTKAKLKEHETRLLEHSLGRQPSASEVAQAMGLSLDGYHQMQAQIYLRATVPLDKPLSEHADGYSLLDVLEDNEYIDPQRLLITQQTVEQLAIAIERLPENERRVITLYFFEELTMMEIGLVLGITESRVSQIQTKSLQRLKIKMAPPFIKKSAL